MTALMTYHHIIASKNLRLEYSHISVTIYNIYIFQPCFTLRILYKAQRIRIMETSREDDEEQTENKTHVSCDLGLDFLVPLPPTEQKVLMHSPDVCSDFSQRTRAALTWAQRHSAEHIQPYKMVLTASDQMWHCGGGRYDSHAPQMWRFSVFNLFFSHLLTSNRLNNWSTDRSMREIIVGYRLQTVIALRLSWKYNIADFPFGFSPIVG